MKQKISTCLMTAALALAPAFVGWCQTCPPQTPYFTNSTTYVIPGNNGNINAGTFANTRSGQFEYGNILLFHTWNTTNYYNTGFMLGLPGYDFQNWSSCNGFASMAANFVNSPQGANSGIIQCSGFLAVSNTTGVSGVVVSALLGNSRLFVSAANITNSGTIFMDASSRMNLTGNNVDLSYGGVSMSTPYSTIIFGTNVGFGVYNAGILDGYWNATNATAGFTPSSLFNGTSATTPPHHVMPRTFMPFDTSIFLPLPATYVHDTGIVASNRFVQVAFVYNWDPDFSSTVYLPSDQIVVQWQYLTTNWPSKESLTTNYLYLTDNFGERTNIEVRVNGRVNPQSPNAPPTYMPINYTIVVGQPYPTIQPPVTPGMPPNTLDNTFLTNQFTAYNAIFTAASELPEDVAYFNVTNLGGRVEINAGNLRLKLARLQALNYLLLNATNHFAGSPGAQIASPNADISLRVTNGFMAVTNLIEPFLPHAEGNLFLWSGRWTNVTVTAGATVTNGYHVLFADNELYPVSRPLIQNLKLTVVSNTPCKCTPGDLVINDILNVSTNFVLSAKSLTIATNDPNAFIPAGQLNLVGPNAVYPTNLPNVMALTNWGQFATVNEIFLGTDATPLDAVINHGTLLAGGFSVFAGFFLGSYTSGLTIQSRQIESDGLLGGLGSVFLGHADWVALSNSALYAVNGSLGISAGSLLSSNEFVYAGGPIDLWITNNLTDGGGSILSNFNYWNASGILNLHLKPPTGDLLCTTISDTGPDFMQCFLMWAAEDRGRSVAGFSNNCAVGHLVLSAGTNTYFTFSAPDASTNYALYVDEIEFVNSATNHDFSSGDYTSFQFDPNMKVYYAQAIANGASIAEKLNGKNGGAFVWVPEYAGNFSATNLLYPDGNVYRLNEALVESPDIDSDYDGVVNRFDPTPVLEPYMLSFSAFRTNQVILSPVRKTNQVVGLTWAAVGYGTNYVYYTTALSESNSNWALLTNFPSGRSGGTNRVFDTITNTNRFYRVRVDPQQQPPQ